MGVWDETTKFGMNFLRLTRICYSLIPTEINVVENAEDCV
jgi:hypothetical protein